MKHITEYMDRRAATDSYKHHRLIWDRVASLFLCQKEHATNPAKRLACTLTLAKMRVPLDGNYVYRAYSYTGQS